VKLTGDMINTSRVLIENSEGTLLGTPSHRWEDNVFVCGLLNNAFTVERDNIKMVKGKVTPVLNLLIATP
jgi:hypothetical protein